MDKLDYFKVLFTFTVSLRVLLCCHFAIIVSLLVCFHFSSKMVYKRCPVFPRSPNVKHWGILVGVVFFLLNYGSPSSSQDGLCYQYYQLTVVKHPCFPKHWELVSRYLLPSSQSSDKHLVQLVPISSTRLASLRTTLHLFATIC